MTQVGAVGTMSVGGMRRGVRRPWPKPRTLPAFVTVVLAMVVLTYVWRVQDLYPILASLQVPILGSLTAIGWFVYSGNTARLRVLWDDSVMRAATLTVVVMIVGVPFSVYQGMSFRFIIDDHIRTFAATAVLAIGLRSFADVERSVLAHVIGAGLFGWLTYTRFDIGAEGRLGDLPYYDANDMGLLMVMAIPLAMHFARRRPGGSGLLRLVMLPVLVLCVLAIVKSGSRGAFIGLVGVGLTLLFTYRVVRWQHRLLGVIVAVALLVAFGGESYWALMKTLLNPSADYNWSGGSETGRMEIWKRGVGYMLSNPLLGVGVRCFSVAEGTLSAQAAQQAIGIGFKWSTAHNSFVQIAGELGISGLVLFVSMLGAAFGKLWRIGRLRPGRDLHLQARVSLAQSLLASLVGFVLTGFFLSMAYGAVLYLMLGQVVALSLALDREAAAGAATKDAVRMARS